MSVTMWKFYAYLRAFLKKCFVASACVAQCYMTVISSVVDQNILA